jgi:alkylhydroperoxidase family enzyme
LDECEALKDWRASTLFGERDRIVLAYTDAVTREIHVPDSVYVPLKGFFNQRQIVELTVLIGTYNMHSRVLQALEIDPQPQA